MPPRPAPDLGIRREQITRAAWRVAEAEGWPAVTMRRIAGEVGATQPVVYSVFAGRQEVIDAVALDGFRALADAVDAVEPVPRARMRAYLDFAAAHPAIYEAMFSMPSDLRFATGSDDALVRAFEAIGESFPGSDDIRVEVAWATLHGLATLEAGGRLPAETSQARFEQALDQVTR